MIPVPLGVRVWLAVGHTDMRRGMNGLALQVQEALGRDCTLLLVQADVFAESVDKERLVTLLTATLMAMERREGVAN